MSNSVEPNHIANDISAEVLYNISHGLYGPFIADLLRVNAVMLDFATLGEGECPFPESITTDNFVRIRELLMEAGFSVREVRGTGRYIIRWGHVGVLG